MNMGMQQIRWMICALALCAIEVSAKVAAELVLSGGRTWQGTLLERDGDWIEFMPQSAVKSIRFGVQSIEQINYDLALSVGEWMSLQEESDSALIIDTLESILRPLQPYEDIPSNVTEYQQLLMKTYYKVASYIRVVSLTEAVMQGVDDVDAAQEAEMFNVLARIALDDQEGVSAYFEEATWLDRSWKKWSPSQLYVAAKWKQKESDMAAAMEYNAGLIAFHSYDTDWLPLAELLSAELYVELGLYASATEVIEQIKLLYPDTQELQRAMKLKQKIARANLVDSLEE